MPKIAKTRTEKRIDYLRGVIAGCCAQNNISTRDIADQFDITERTASNWITKPESCNIQKMFELLDYVGADMKINLKNCD